MKIIEYFKDHPVAGGFIVVVGGIIFILIVRGGGGSSTPANTGPSDAQVAAEATIQAAQIQANAGVNAAQVGAGVQLNSDNKAAEVAMAQIAAQQNIYDEYLKDKTTVDTAQISANTSKTNAIISQIPGLKHKQEVLQALITGQVVPVNPNSGNSASSILNGIGNLLTGAGNAASGITGGLGF